MGIRPTTDRHYVAIDEPDTKVGAIFLPLNSADPKCMGTVLESGKNDEGVEKGSRVLFHKYAGHQIEGEQDGGGTAMLHTDDILATFEEDEA